MAAFDEIKKIFARLKFLVSPLIPFFEDRKARFLGVGNRKGFRDLG